MIRALMWLRLVSLVALPALGTAGVILEGGPASGADALLRVLVGFLLTAAPTVLFVGMTFGIFSFPTHPLRALATVFLTPVLLLATTFAMGWSPWMFFVDECFAELGGMGIGSALAAVIHGAGSGRVRGCGAFVFAGAGVAALAHFGQPMLAGRRIDVVWVALNTVALIWSVVVFYDVFSHHGRRKRAEDEAKAAGAPVPPQVAEENVVRPPSGAARAFIVVGLLAWIAAFPAGAVWTMSMDSSSRDEKGRDADAGDEDEDEAEEPKKKRRRRRRPRR